LQSLLEQANQPLGRLDGLASVLPDLSLFLYAYVRKEAVLSSQIEGIQSSLSDLLLFESEEAPGVRIQDVQEVSSYVSALGRRIPDVAALDPRDSRGAAVQGRGCEKSPGEFRRSQNWIGGTRPGNAVFVPTPPELVLECMGELEHFFHVERADLPLLIKAGLVHAQFLCAAGVLREPPSLSEPFLQDAPADLL